MLQRNSRLRPPRIAVNRLEMKPLGSGLPMRVRTYEAMHTFPNVHDGAGADNIIDDKANPGASKLLIEEFYEYGGKAVCSNHVFNFKIGKCAFVFYLKS
jgi:hypothetical protein